MMLSCAWCQARVQVAMRMQAITMTSDGAQIMGNHAMPPAPWTQHDGKWDCGQVHMPVPPGVVITHRHNGIDARGQLCRCSKCGLEAKCSPTQDFFVKGDDPDDGKPLFCESCFFEDVTGTVKPAPKGEGN